MKKGFTGFNDNWTLFIDAADGKVRSAIPKTVKSPDGKRVKALSVKAEDSVIDIGKIAGGAFEKCRALLFNEFEAEESFLLRVGAAADWWMEVSINGSCVYSTMKTGNEDGSFCTSRHVFDVPVLKGRNLLSVVVESGVAGWQFVLGDISDTPHPPFTRFGTETLVPVSVRMDRYRQDWRDIREELDSRIETYRKEDCSLAIFDSLGKPIEAAELKICQKSHDFIFGCNILPIGQLGTEKNERYEDAFRKLFNLATTTLTWCDIEPEEGRLRFDEKSPEIWRRPPIDRVLNFCRKNNIAMKGQPLLTDHWTPKWVPNEQAKFRGYWKTFVRKIAERYGKEFKIIDVANEFLDTAARIKENNIFMPNEETVSNAFQAAAELFPSDCTLEINEMTYVNEERCDDYCSLIQRSMERGADIGSIGCQFHLFSLYRHLRRQSCSPWSLLENYKKLAGFGKPLYITEVTIPAMYGEDMQSEVLENLYRLWFSVPEMSGIIYWNLNDGAAWQSEGNAKGGLLDEELREKPAYQKLYQLIHREWNTKLNLQTDSSGKAQFRGFCGTYEVTVSANGISQSFPLKIVKNNKPINRIVLK